MGIDSYSCIWALVLSDSSLVLSRRQAIIWTNADLSVIRWLTSNLEFCQTYFIRNNNWKISSVNGSHFVQVSKCWCYIFQLHTDGKITVASNHFAFTHNQWIWILIRVPSTTGLLLVIVGMIGIYLLWLTEISANCLFSLAATLLSHI